MKKVFVNSLPKAGTNLLAKCLELLGLSGHGHIGSGRILSRNPRAQIRRLLSIPIVHSYIVGIDTPAAVSRGPVERLLKSVREGEFCTAHVGYTNDLLVKAIELDFAPVVVVRDPRAVALSFMHYVKRDRNHILHRAYLKLSQERRYEVTILGGFLGSVYLQPLRTRCFALKTWLEAESSLMIRFEDLVGKKGGGSSKRQREAIASLCSTIGVDFQKLDVAMEYLFGPGRHTFRQGQVDAWRQELPSRAMNLLETNLGDIMESWGYK